MGQLFRVGAPLGLTTGVESVLWGFLLGSGWNIAVGMGGGSGVAGAEGKETLFPENFKECLEPGLALPLQSSEAFRLAAVFGPSPGPWYCPPW